MKFMIFSPQEKWWVSKLNILKEVRSEMSLPERVLIKDESLREGAETPGVSLTLEQKLKIAEKLENLGITEIELGYAGASKEDFEVFKAFKNQGFRLKLSSHTRAYIRDWKGEVDRVIESGADIVNFLMHTAEPILESRKLAQEDLAGTALECVQYSKDHGMYTIFGCDATRTDPGLLRKIYVSAVDAKPDRLWIYDGLGCALPSAMKYLTKRVKNWSNGIPVGVHCHNDYGLATACTLAAIEAGAEAVDLVINGLGDRAGNAALEEVVVALTVLYGIGTGLRLEKLYDVSKCVQEITGVHVQPNKAIVGENAFIHESDSHIFAILKEGWYSYENFQPEVVGQKRKLLFGLTTLHGSAIQAKSEKMGIKLTKTEVDKIVDKVADLSKKKRYVSENELEELINETLRGMNDNAI